MGLANGAGSVTLPTSFGGKGPDLKQWLVTQLSAPRRFPNLGFPVFSSVVRQMPGNLLHCPRFPLIPLSPSSFSLQRLTDETEVTNPGQMAYQAGNLWLRPKPVGSRRSLRTQQVLPGRQHIWSENFLHLWALGPVKGKVKNKKKRKIWFECSDMSFLNNIIEAQKSEM